ncbi:MAG: helix-turn-helix transcriptional regulator [Synechococcales cyanobacterium C42_A2020_086]|nr:helix-turn-helix transcriptional regulator [Synechococcales cyanobacterium C42_A2020_086]
MPPLKPVLEFGQLVAQEHPNKHISSILGISPWTVSTYLRRIFTKLGVASRTAMVARLIENNLLEETKSRGQAARWQPHSPSGR